MIKYKQCKLEKPVKNGKLVQTTFLPEKFAKKGKFLKLKEADEWVDGWEVIEVSKTFVNKDQLPDVNKAVRLHRKNTGDDLPKRKNK